MEQTLVQGDNQQERLQADIEWLAGILDSEGCIRANYQDSALHARVYIGNCDRRLVDEAARIFASLNVGFGTSYSDSKNPRHRGVYSVYASGYGNVRQLLSSVSPLLVGKKDVAQKVLLLCEIRMGRFHHPIDEKERKLVEEIGVLNSRGNHPQRLCAERIEIPMIQSGLHGDMQSAAETTVPSLDWLGGFIDGDGWVALSKHNTFLCPSIGATNTNKKNLEAVAQTLGHHQVPFYLGRNNPVPVKHCHKEAYRINVQGLKRCNKLLSRITPHIRAKRTQANLLQWFITSRLSRPKNAEYSEEEMDVFEKIQELNRRGK